MAATVNMTVKMNHAQQNMAKAWPNSGRSCPEAVSVYATELSEDDQSATEKAVLTSNDSSAWDKDHGVREVECGI
jgi:hypothetical protein